MNYPHIQSTDMPYKKTWQPTEELILIDILHKPTREKLAEKLAEKINVTESLNIAFPINGNNVSRVSDVDTKIHDDNVLKAICALNPLIDGYYMNKITKRVKNNNGVNINKTIFHSEVGLCSNAFHKIKLINSEKSNNAPPVNRNRKRTRNNINRYNNRNSRNNRNNRNNINNINKPENNTINPLSLSKRLFND